MNDPSLLRFAWKEYRVLRGFWLSLALMAVAGQLFVVTFLSETVLLPRLFGIALVAAALYALGNGATMFATEREEETYDLLRVLPVTSRQVLFGKLVFSVVSLAAIAVVLWLSAWLWAGMRVPPPVSHRLLWATFGLGALELLVWGVFFSLLSSRPLQAAILGVVATSASVTALVTLDGNGRLIHTLPVYMNVIPMRLAIVALMAVVDFGLAMRWLRPLSETSRANWPLLARRRSREHDDVVVPTITSGQASLARLTWQAWRQSRTVYGCVILAVLVLAALIWDSTSHASYDVMVLLSGASLLGSAVFLGDQEKLRFRFFAEHGVSARRVWLSRQLLGAAVLMVFAIIVGAVLILTGDGKDFLNLLHGPRTLNALGRAKSAEWLAFAWTTIPVAMVLAYASAQPFSMLTRNGLLAGFFGLLLAAPVCFWALLMVRFEFNPLWSVVPIPVALLLATWLRAPEWIAERNAWRAWLSVGLVVALPVLSVATTAAWKRGHEIPAVAVGFDVNDFGRPRTKEERETASIYREAVALVRSHEMERGSRVLGPLSPVYGNAPLDDHDRKWLDVNRRPLAMAREASSRESCILSDPGSRDFYHSIGLERLGALLIIAGREYEEKADFSRALDNYLAALRLANHMRNKGSMFFHYAVAEIEQAVFGRLSLWSGLKGQTADLLRRALDSLAQLDAERRPLSDAIKSDYLVARRRASANIEAMQGASMSGREVRWVVLASWLMPWELERSRRLLDYVTRYGLRTVRSVETDLETGTPAYGAERSWYYRGVNLIEHPGFAFESTSSGMRRRRLGPRTASWLRNTYDVSSSVNNFIYGWRLYSREYELATERRALRVVLALQIWLLENGELPRSLDDLVGEILETLPFDPFTGKPFRYFPDGVPNANVSPFSASQDIALGTPLIWSPGWELELIWDDDLEGDTAFLLVDHRWRTSNAISAREAIPHGWAFIIP